jgi:hypothetical protein
VAGDEGSSSDKSLLLYRFLLIFTTKEVWRFVIPPTKAFHLTPAGKDRPLGTPGRLKNRSPEPMQD